MRLSQRIVLKYIRTKFKILSSISKRKAAKQAFDLFCTPQYRNKKKLPGILEMAEKLSFQFMGFTIMGYRWNTSVEKKILILHGFESSVINFEHFIKPLIQKKFCVLAFDAPAHGRSTGKMINVLLYKNFINHINNQYGPIKNFIAHSLGALALSLYLEESPHDEQYKIVFIAPATETTTAIDSFFNFIKLGPEVRKEFDLLIEQMGFNKPKWFSVARAAKNIRANVLWFQDKEDSMTPLSDVQPLIEKNYSNFRFVITEGLGHRRIYRDNKVSKAIIEFL